MNTVTEICYETEDDIQDCCVMATTVTQLILLKGKALPLSLFTTYSFTLQLSSKHRIKI